MHELSDIVGSSGVRSYVTFSEEIDRHCDAVAVARNYAWLGDLRHRLLAEREDLVPIITGALEIEAFFVEKTVTIDTTAAGGNASLMAGNR
jgi:delta 1-pyrroline-5-carboxylate dehydrogenase